MKDDNKKYGDSDDDRYYYSHYEDKDYYSENDGFGRARFKIDLVYSSIRVIPRLWGY
ncbi:hypothetical protein [Butyrivibrio fibrisolvens]|uniref:hypothetical protein n=1 Tax=Butyrivibrio fibrisolvens TaxID=831 RepID=UPI0004176131|nr:hypothetical protein [Butyrivibrio fibrisolvens]